GAAAPWPDVVGTWQGEARFAVADGGIATYTETIVIERQEDELVWGKVVWTNDAGEPMESGLLGIIRGDRRSFLLTQETATWSGTVEDGALHALLTFSNGGSDHGVAEVVLTRR
ncbi:MAG: hypothetical protein ACKOTZ_00290, partial [Chloroflexota bacterium]